MTPADSKLLARLDAALGTARNPIHSACLRAERAGYRARQGHFDEARGELDALRLQFAMRPQPEVSAWLSLLEGWILYYDNLDVAALDRMKRAHALSAAASLRRLHALSAAWLAHMHSAFSGHAAAAHHVREALEIAASDDHAARARASLVVAGMCHFAGRFDLAKPWYVKARTHARADDDAQTLSALSYNMASLHTSEAMQAVVFGGDADPLIRQATAAMESTGSFDGWIGTEALGSLLPMMRATIASLSGGFEQALALFGDSFERTEKEGMGRVVALLLAERAWCRQQTGNAIAAAADARAAEERINAGMHDDDRACAHGRLAQVLLCLGDRARSESHRAAAHDALGRHQAAQARVMQALVGQQIVESPEAAQA